MTLHVLIVGQSSDDTNRIDRYLHTAGYDPSWDHALDETSFRAALHTPPDVIIAYYNTPSSLTAADALRLLDASEQDIPFIVVHGPSDETEAVEWLRQGASDYIMDEHLPRLGRAIIRVLDERRVRLALLQADEHLRRLNRAYRTLSECNQILVRTKDERQLLHDVCQVLVEMGGYALAWVGFAEHDAAQTVRPVAAAGAVGYLEAIHVSWSHQAAGEGPSGKAIRSGQPVIAHNTLTDPNFAPWREAAQQYGFASSIALPLLTNSHTFGMIGLYSAQLDAFDDEEVTLLKELAGDMAYGITALRTRQERERAEAALRESEEKYRLLFDHSLNAIALHQIVTDEQGKPVDYIFLDANAQFEEQTGLSVPDLLGQRVTDVLPGIEQEEFISIYGRIALGGEPQHFEQHSVQLGRIYDIVAFSPMYGKFATVFSDVTERKRFEDQLRQSEEKYRLLAETARDLIFIHGMDGRLSYANQAALDMMGCTAETVTTRNIVQFVSGDYSQELIVRRQARRAGSTARFLYEVTLTRSTGQILPLEISSAPIVKEGKVDSILLIARDITERKQAEETLRYQATLLQTISEAVIATDLDFVVQSWNEAAETMYGWQAEEAIGHSLLDIVPSTFPNMTPEQARATLFSIGSWRGEELQRTKTGPILYVLASMTLIRDEGGHPVGIVSINHDITQRKRAEEALHESEARYRKLFEGIDDSVFVHDLQGNILDVNETACRCLGYTRDELLAMQIRALEAPDFAAGFNERLSDQIIAGATNSIGGELIAKDGHRIPVDTRTKLIVYQEQPAILAVVRDMTEYRRAEEAEREQRTLAQALIDATAVLNSSLDLSTVLDGILTSVGRVVAHDAANIMLIEDGAIRVVGHRGYAEHGLIDWIEHLDWRVEDVANLREVLHTGRPLAISRVNDYADWLDTSESQWIRSFACAPITSEGQVIGFLNLDSAIPRFYSQTHAEHLQAFANQASLAVSNARLYAAAQSHAEELEQHVAARTRELRESEARYRAIVEDQTELITRFLPDGGITFANNATCRYFDRQLSALIGTPCWEFVFEDDREFLKRAIESLTPETPVLTIEPRVYGPDGALRWMEWTIRLISNPAEHPQELQSVGRDITERKRSEELLHKTLAHEIELNELKSRFVSLVSHEFRTPLAVLQMKADILQRYTQRLSDEEKTEYLEGIHLSIRRMTDLLDDVLTLNRAEAGRLGFKPEPLDLVPFCQSIIEEIRATADPGLRFLFSSAGNCTIDGDKQLLRSIMTNLISNAAKYTPAGGRIDIRLACHHERDQIVFSVKDTGIGIPEADQARLFEMFHRARNVGKVSGTGLGLAIARQCVERHGGTITFVSEEGQGTTFTVTLPCTADDTPSNADSPA